MAKYNRKIVIPYLRDLYCTELLLLKKREERQSVQERKNQLLERIQKAEDREKPVDRTTVDLLVLSVLSAILCFITVMTTVFPSAGKNLFAVYLTGSVALGLLFGVFLLRKWNFHKKQAEYQKWKNKQEASEKRIREQIAECDRQLEDLAEKCNVLHAIQHSLYSVNIIPLHYRTLQVVQYLFEYFVTSKADNLDLILQTFAIEEIREPHLAVSWKLGEMTLHQRMILAMQNFGDDEERMIAQSQLQAIVEQETNGELRIQYQKIILENWNMSNYFLKYEQN